MQEQNQPSVEVLDLEYDVAGVASEESSTAECNEASTFLVSYRQPQQTA